MNPAYSRLIEVDESGQVAGADGGSPRRRVWHVLDNGGALSRAGVTPVGTILCVHGNPTWSYLWRRLLDAATDAATSGAAPWRVIAVDQLNMGFSERTGTIRGLARRVRDLSDLTAAMRLEGPIVTLGHDWGGVISLGWAVDHPQQLAGIMLLNTAVHQPENQRIPAPLRLALQPAVLGAATVTTPLFLETTLGLAHPPLSSAVKAGYRAPYRRASQRGGIGGFVADIPVDAEHASYAELARIAQALRSVSVRSLMLWGPRDPIFADRYLDDLAARLRNADVHRFEGAGHLIAEDVDYTSRILAWLGEKGLGEKGLREKGLGENGLREKRLGEKGLDEKNGRTNSPEEPESGERVPLWAHLERRRDDPRVALIEMAPPRLKKPRSISWRLLSRRVRELAAGLSAIGIRKGDRVSLLIPPGADLTAALYACLRIGAVVVVADAGLGATGLTRAVRGTWPDYVIGARPGLSLARVLSWPGTRISTQRLSPALKRSLGVTYSLGDIARLGIAGDAPVRPEPTAHDLAAILFTSGSTGPAKGVVYTHAQLEALVAALASQYGIGPDTGLVAGFAPFALLGPALGVRSVTPDMDVTSPASLTARAVGDATERADADVVFLSPAALANVVATSGGLTREGASALAKVKTFLSAGAPVPESLLAAAARLMPSASAHSPYGMTEGLLIADISLAGVRESIAEDAQSPAAELSGVCVGTAGPGVRIAISPLDSDGVASGTPRNVEGVTGEIVVSAPHLKAQYFRLWDTDRAARRDVAPDEHWHRTGDVGHLDAKGRLWVEGRLPHVIVTARGVVTPVGLEQRIESLPGVRRAAVVGVGPVGTEQLVAVVESVRPVRRVTLGSPKLAAAVRGSVSQPVAAVIVIPRLPTDIRHNSKIDRSALSAWASDVLAGGRFAQP